MSAVVRAAVRSAGGREASARGHDVSDISAFAERIGIAPGIVVGRLQREEILAWSQGNGLKRAIGFVDTD